ncbi:YwdI family protein [Virgibacillus sp. NKC19-16]|uniref:YwdI family protein n=1 Tax=Virgibacillus salidurans TaxID=2831673 RepID=UPI001F44EFA2|nr:YwdI family protein [Virgibacillus sp. NKC19-16]UJL46026.1 YwdI family protein [Virgibacillus sp. NKC19-16]
MEVGNNTVIQKMITELNHAKEQHNQDKMIKHIENVRLLCDLFLEEDSPSTGNKEAISAEEMKAMLGKQSSENKQRTSTKMDHDVANGDSIFDF